MIFSLIERELDVSLAILGPIIVNLAVFMVGIASSAILKNKLQIQD